MPDFAPQPNEMEPLRASSAFRTLRPRVDPERCLLSVILPVYNEEATVARVVDRIRECQPIPTEIIAVDDASADRSADVLQALREEGRIDRLIVHERNRGKGAALRTGIDSSRGTFVVIQDADLEYDPRDYSRLLAPLLADEADVVYGARFLPVPGMRGPYWHRLVNRLLTVLSNLCSGLDVHDMETCYKAFRGDFLRGLPLRAERFGFEPEITARVAQSGLRVAEVAVSYRGRSYGEGKKITWRDGVAALWHIVRFNLLSRSIPPVELSPLSELVGVDAPEPASGLEDPSSHGRPCSSTL